MSKLAEAKRRAPTVLRVSIWWTFQGHVRGAVQSEVATRSTGWIRESRRQHLVRTGIVRNVGVSKVSLHFHSVRSGGRDMKGRRLLNLIDRDRHCRQFSIYGHSVKLVVTTE